MENPITIMLISSDSIYMDMLNDELKKSKLPYKLISSSSQLSTNVDLIESGVVDILIISYDCTKNDIFKLLLTNNLKTKIVIFSPNTAVFKVNFAYDILHVIKVPFTLKSLNEIYIRYKKNFIVRAYVPGKRDDFNPTTEKIVVPMQGGIVLIDIDEVIRMEADGNYTILITRNDLDSLVVSRSISYFEKLLQGCNYCRIHKCHLVNLRYIKKYVRGRGGYVVMHNNKSIAVAESKRSNFITKLKRFSVGD